MSKTYSTIMMLLCTIPVTPKEEPDDISEHQGKFVQWSETRRLGTPELSPKGLSHKKRWLDKIIQTHPKEDSKMRWA